MDVDQVLLALTADKLGFTTRLEARQCGLSRSAVRHLIAQGAFTVHGRRVLHRTGAPWSKASPLMRAVLDAGPGAVLSHTTAAAWWGLPGFDLRTIHITRPRGLTGAPASHADSLHEVLDLSSDQVTVLEGIPIVRPERLLFELCGSVHPGRAERALDTALAKGLCSCRSVRRLHGELAGRGRAGSVVLRRLLKARPPGYKPPESNLERRFEAIAREAGLGAWRRQVDVGDDERWCGRVDFLHERLPVIVEVQSKRYHTAFLDVAHDRDRRERLVAAAFVVVEVWDEQLWYAKDEVIDTVKPALREAERRRILARRAAERAADSAARAAESAARTRGGVRG